MGPGGLNYRVRDGNGCDPSGMIAGKLVKQSKVDSLQLTVKDRIAFNCELLTINCQQLLNRVASKIKGDVLNSYVDALSRFMVKPNGRLVLVS